MLYNNHNVKPTVDLQKIKQTDSKHTTVENNQFTKNSSNKGENKRPTQHPGNNWDCISTLAWKTPWTEEPGGLQSMGLLRVRRDWATSLSLFTFHFHALEKKMTNHSSVLAWRIPGTGEPAWAAIYGVAQSRTLLKWLSSSSSSSKS